MWNAALRGPARVGFVGRVPAGRCLPPASSRLTLPGVCCPLPGGAPSRVRGYGGAVVRRPFARTGWRRMLVAPLRSASAGFHSSTAVFLPHPSPGRKENDANIPASAKGGKAVPAGPSPAMKETERSVNFAVLANAVIAVVKGGACAFTGSAVMFSETLHSLGDTANQALLWLGMRKGKQQPDLAHPYGYGREPFIYALMSAMGVLFLGSGVAVYHGTSLLLSAEPHVVESYPLALSVLGVSFALEAASFAQALKAVRMSAQERGVGLYQFLSDGGSDPWGVAILLEDGVGLLGASLAATTLGLAAYTGNTIYDAVGSLAIGGLLGLSALFLIDKNRRVLLGGAGGPGLRLMRREAMDVLRADPVVEYVRDVKAEMTGPAGEFRFKAEVRFDGWQVARTCLEAKYGEDHRQGDERLAEVLREIHTPDQFRHFLQVYGADVVDTLATEVDRVEWRIREKVPRARHIDLENDR